MTDNKRTPEEEFEELRRMAEELNAASMNANDDDALIKIKLEADKLIENLDTIEQTLIDKGACVYQRDRAVVTIGMVKAVSCEGKETTYQAIVPLNPTSLREIVAHYCVFIKKDTRHKTKWVVTLPPTYLMEGLLNRASFKLPVLRGIVNHPYITHAGVIVTIAGYNKNTGIYFDPLGIEFPLLPEITIDNAHELALTALARIEKLFHTFKFVTPASRSVALSQLMTGVSRRSMRTAPIHVGDAAVRGSGKSKISCICSIVAIGKPAPALNQGYSHEEFEKRLASMLIAGHAIIHIDNCSAIVDGDLLNSVSTEETVALRPLGQSRIVEITTGSLVCPNGNNIIVRGDAIRRCVKYRLDPGVDRPEELQFDYDPIADALANRAEIVIEVLTILKARHVAKVAAPRVWQSFEDWSNTVRSALVWLGCADPCETVEELASDDPELAEMRAVYSQWWNNIGVGWHGRNGRDTITVANVIKRATVKEPAKGEGGEPLKNEAGEPVMKFVYPEFRQALLAVASDGHSISSVKLGHWLKSHLDRRVRVDDWVLRIVKEKELSREGVAQWRMVGEYITQSTTTTENNKENGDDVPF
jgi:hypothetical protein